MSDLIQPKNLGEAMLLRLKQLGVDFFFANPGTEFVSVIQAFQSLKETAVPKPTLAAHEFQAISMAYGSYLATQRPQAVMTHANVGAANALIGLIGAARMNIPIIFIAGMTSFSERGTTGARNKLIHWSQDARDAAGLYREYVKWDVEVQDASTLYDVLDRAYAIAMTPPYGPVAIRIARDILIREDIGAVPLAPQVRALSRSTPTAQEMQQVSGSLESATKVLLITNRLGLDTEAVKLLSRLSDRHGLAVVTPDDFYMSFPHNHPNHLGFRHSSALREADLVIVLDTEVPWYPLENGPRDDAQVIHVGSDPLFQSIPIRSHRGDSFVRSDPRQFLLALDHARPKEALVVGRNSWIQLKKIDSRKSPRTLADGLDAQGVSSVLSEILDKNTTLINELGLVPETLACQYPGQYFRSGSASPLGWGVGCGLGIALGKPEQTIIVCVGDGVFYFSPVLAALTFAAEKKIAFLLVVLNNGGMRSIAGAAQEFYPGLPADSPLTDFYTEGIHFENCATFASGLGLRATSQVELRQALRRGLDFAKSERRPVVINALVKKGKGI